MYAYENEAVGLNKEMRVQLNTEQSALRCYAQRHEGYSYAFYVPHEPEAVLNVHDL